jgi:predicted DNA-binding transcriptional regulator AlpA
MTKIINRIIREKERCFLTGVPSVSWWRMEKSGKAPVGFKIGTNAKGWLLKDIDQWIQSKAEAANDQ